jgi:glycine hydroxymethyltransferase
VLCTEEFAEQVDKGCPLVIGGPLGHIMASKVVALRECNTKEFKDYAKRIVVNSQALAQACMDEGMEVLTKGTDNHLLLIDVRGFNLNGRQAEGACREAGITLNRNSIPGDPNGAWFTSGLRVGTPAATTLGMGAAEMKEIAAVLKVVLSNTKPGVIEKGKNKGKPSRSKFLVEDASLQEAQARINSLLERFPVYPELDLNFLTQSFL